MRSVKPWQTPRHQTALPQIKVEEPTVRMTFGVNTSPFSGKEGKWSTSRKLRERLMNELRNNVALRVSDTESADTFVVAGRASCTWLSLLKICAVKAMSSRFHGLKPSSTKPITAI